MKTAEQVLTDAKSLASSVTDLASRKFLVLMIALVMTCFGISDGGSTEATLQSWLVFFGSVCVAYLFAQTIEDSVEKWKAPDAAKTMKDLKEIKKP